MNRLVIVGNGFDLAHGLPTGYCDFINDFWSNLKTTYKREEVKNIVTIHDSYASFLDIAPINNFNDFKRNIELYAKEYGLSYHDAPHQAYFLIDGRKVPVVDYPNYFFKLISKTHSINNWVDVENIYYDLLKDSLQEVRLSDHHLTIKGLNDDFENVKELLRKYLIQEVEEKFDFTIEEHNPIKTILSKTRYENHEYVSFSAEFSKKEEQEFKEEFSKKPGQAFIRPFREIDQTYLLTFNYTSLIQSYKATRQYQQLNYIHGQLDNRLNEMNFGFGDEMDKRYSDIEEKNDNEYLKNIKSFAYSNNSNYKSLLDFIEEEKFQVYIFGHSCGLSDRTLLNTIFEHHNCISIKIYYHKFDTSSENGKLDNYTEIVQNISRHFNKKKLMREKIVNKTFCQPLPQIKLVLK